MVHVKIINFFLVFFKRKEKSAKKINEKKSQISLLK